MESNHSVFAASPAPPSRTETPAAPEDPLRSSEPHGFTQQSADPFIFNEANTVGGALSPAGSKAAPRVPPASSYNMNGRGLPCDTSEEDASKLKLLYLWASGLMLRGFKYNLSGEALQQEDLLLLPRDEEAMRCYEGFKTHWDDELARAAPVSTDEGGDAPSRNLFGVLLRTTRRNLILGGIGHLLYDASSFVIPFFLRELINWLTDVTLDPSSRPKSVGYIWAAAIGVAQLIGAYANNASLFYTSKALCQMRSCVAIAVFDKSAQLESDSGLEGVAVQLHTVDAAKFIDMVFFFQRLWASPIIIVGSLIALNYFIGWGGVICIAAVIAFIPLQGLAGAKGAAHRVKVSEWADQRLSAMAEILFGIRIVKFMGWEKPLEHKISVIREQELALFKWMYFWRSVINVLVTFQPALVSFVVFAIAYALDDPITPSTVFPTLAMLGVFRMPMLAFPLALASLIDLKVSLARIGAFLSTPEKRVYLQRRSHSNNKKNAPAIALEHVTCQYIEADTASPRDILTDINLTIPQNALTVIVGATGCGKSTLVKALLGEAKVDDRSVATQNGTVAFVPQESWMMNATVRDNILMGKPFDEQLYIKTVKACQLMADLKQLKASDMTEIGERGINVSGGQKQRVAFARAVYSDRDIIVMDDPLSAVDAHVAAALFDHCICGALAAKTRVLVTHHVQFLSRADNIIVMGDRCVEFVGSYDDLMRSEVGVGLSVKLSTYGHGSAADDEEELGDSSSASPLDATSRQPDGGDDDDELRQQTEIDNLSDAIPPPQEDTLMTEETAKVGGLDTNALRWFFTSQGLFTVFNTALAFAICKGVGVVSDLILSWWSTRTGFAGFSNVTDKQYLQWYGIFVGLQAVCLCIRQVPYSMTNLNGAREVHASMISRLLKAPTRFYDTTPAGRILARCSKDVEMNDLTLPGVLNFVYSSVFDMLGVFAIVCYASQWLILLVVAGLVVYVFIWRFFAATNRAQKRIEAINRSPLASIITQTLSGISTIRAYDCISHFDAMHTQAVNVAARSTFSWRATLRWLRINTDLLSTTIIFVVAIVACAVVFGGSTVADRSDKMAVLSLALTHCITISQSMGYVVNDVADAESSLNSIERCYEYAFEIEQEDDLVYGDCAAAGEKPPPPAGWPRSGALSLDNVCLRYAADKPLVLKNVCLEVAPKEKVGIVGRTGSGKSTLMLALFRMVEIESGSICFDGINLRDVKMADVRQALTIIPQDPMLFQGTIRSNLDPFNKATDDQVWEVLKKVGMKERVDDDGRGLGALVTEKGNNFSVGQRQLLCLARALLKKCKILLLDEATASVDFECDALIQKTIRKEFHDVTILTIAHRLATVIDSDKVLVMDHGVVAEYDSPAALLRNVSGHFHSMVSALGADQCEHLKELAWEADRNLSANTIS